MTFALKNYFAALKAAKAGDANRYEVFALVGEVAGHIVAAKADTTGRIDDDQPVKLFTPQELNEGAAFNTHMAALLFSTKANTAPSKPEASPIRIPKAPIRITRNVA
ncbi:hypothetical protein [Agrobacterium fabrum]|uniref:hypothetical protein n=1 Tax=Agrobacterium fabrum TaxID=1176649 RepID=UPI00215801A3|nr:hypothetical protein [Agrobacterium fabrum]MCR6722804.1 hypothetical protein [Agrobacterium fabrum]